MVQCVGIALMLLFGIATAFRQQSVGVKGQLVCGDQPVANELIKLINHNTVGFDDQLATVKTDAQGYYTIQGGLGSLLSMEVKMKIYTDCNDGLVLFTYNLSSLILYTLSAEIGYLEFGQIENMMSGFRMLPVLAILLTAVDLSSALLDQSIAIKGQLVCGDKPSTGDTVKLINHNTFTFDNELASGTTDEQGFYELSGILQQITTMDPRFKIITSCNTAMLNPCNREISLGIPDEYVSRSTTPDQVFNGGVLQLKFKFHDEDHKYVFMIINYTLKITCLKPNGLPLQNTIATIATTAFRTQSAGVKGTLLCGDKPLVGARVKLWDDDSGPDLDDLLQDGTTNSEGYFELSGTTSELSTIDPVLKIYHDCDDGIMPCQREVSFEIPDSYVQSGEKVKKFFNIGTINMQIIFERESRDCIHRK
ncbi:unnamed protein product [Anisakis simplex]|uniref:Transthyretin-like family protein n=1 Tax=Anisakis simplex TaxID=6269 RepID=A0A158PPE0_ANISI|nr:unnamed protein product [Anisakis simplex]